MRMRLDIRGDRFFIDDEAVYSDIPGCPEGLRGLLMNARLIQGIFDDKADPGRFARFGRSHWDPEANTDALIRALPAWRAYGLRALTVGFQGGQPGFGIDNATVDNNPFGADGKRLDPAYARRMDRLLRAAGELGMVVIVSALYAGQAWRLEGATGVMNAVATVARFLREGGYGNVILEVANEHDLPGFESHPLVYHAEGAVALMDLARRESGGLPVGCSRMGGSLDREVALASDVVLFHANDCTRQRYARMVETLRSWGVTAPLVCNEDSQSLGQLEVAANTQTSWGWMGVMSKQAPPADWRILPGEDLFFARRMARILGIPLDPLPEAERFLLQGLAPHEAWDGQRFVRLAAEFPERIDRVEFFCNDERVSTTWDEPFQAFQLSNYHQSPWPVRRAGERWRAVVHLRDGIVEEKDAVDQA